MAPLVSSSLALSCLLTLSAAQYYGGPRTSTPTKIGTSPLPSSTGTSLRSTGTSPHSTGTSPYSTGHSTTANGSCSTTFTETVIVSLSFTSIVGTYTIDPSADVINGDDFGYTNPLSSETFIRTEPFPTAIDSTSTFTFVSTPTSTLGTVVTVSVPTSFGFIPIKDSLPSATYIPYSSTASFAIPSFAAKLARRAAIYCNATTVTKTTTLVVDVISTSTQTLTGTVIAFPEEGTAFELSTFVNPKKTTTVTSFIPYPSVTVTTTVLANTTITVNATTTTSYAACATTNFANYVRQPDGANFAIRSVTHEDAVSPQPLYLSPEECCAIALGSGAAAWAWVGYGLGLGCYTVADTAGSCGQEGTAVTAFVEAEITDFDITPIYGNAYCGTVDASAPFVNITGNPGST